MAAKEENGHSVVIDKAKGPKLVIHYYADTDTLVLWNGTPASEGRIVAEHLTIVAEHLTSESNAEDEITGMVLEHAAELLRPHLFPDGR